MAGDVDELTFADVEIHVFQRMRMGAGVGLCDLLEPDHLSVMLLRTVVTFVKAAGATVVHTSAPPAPPALFPPAPRPLLPCTAARPALAPPGRCLPHPPRTRDTTPQPPR